MTHELKIKQIWYDRLVSGEKTHEVRLNDRDYQVGDEIVLTSATDISCGVCFEITHVLTSEQFPEGIKDGYVVLSLKKL